MSVAAIIETLEQMVVAHEELLETARIKKHAIIANDLEQLTKHMMTENRLNKRIGQLEAERGLESTKVMAAKGVYSRVAVTQKQLMSVVFEVEERVRLQQLHEQLGKVVKELVKVNEDNQQLLKQSLDFIQFSLEIIVSPEDESYTYSNPAEFKYGPSNAGRYNSKF